MANKKVIALIRTSTIKQEVESQNDELIEYIKRDGISQDDIIIVGDKGASARKQDEAYLKNLQTVYDHIEDGNISTVYAWAIDRIGRKEVTLFTFKDFLIKNHVQLVIKNPSLRLLDPDGTVNHGTEIAFSLFATMAQQEMESKFARFERAKRRNASQGKFNGGKVHFGYTVDEDGNIEADERDEGEANIVRLIFDLYASGEYSTTSLTKELKQRGITVRGKAITLHFITNMLKSTAFIGYTEYSKVDKSDKTNPKVLYTQKRIYPRIISDETFNAVKARLNANFKGDISRRSKRTTLASKLIICPQCGRHWYASNRTYTCIGHKYHGKDIEGVETCPNNEQISIEWMDIAAWYVAKSCELDYILSFTEDKAEQAKEQIRVNRQKIDTLRERIGKIDERKERIAEMYIAGDISKETQSKQTIKLKADLADYQKSIVALEEENSKLQNLVNYEENKEFKIVNIGTLSMRGIYDDAEENYRICHKHIKSITVEPYEYQGKMQKMITIKSIYKDLETRLLYIAKSKVMMDGHVIKLYQDFNGEFKPIWAWPEFVPTEQMMLDSEE